MAACYGSTKISVDIGAPLFLEEPLIRHCEWH